MSTPSHPTDALELEQQLERDIAVVMQAAFEHHRRQEFDQAASHYTAILEAIRDHASANHHLGLLLVQTGRPAEAWPHFEAALGREPDNGAYWVGYINALIESGQNEAARAACDAAQQLGVRKPAFATLLARMPSSDTRRASTEELNQHAALFSNGEIEASLNIALRLTTHYPSHGECWRALALSQQRLGQYAESVPVAEHAVRLLRNDLVSHMLLASGLCAIADWPRAEAHCREALEQFPHYAELHRMLANSLTGMHRYTDSIASCRRAAALAPGHADIYGTLGTALLGHGQNEEAETAYRRALELTPMDASAYTALLHCLMHKVDRDMAMFQAEAREFAKRHEAPLREQWPRHANPRDPSRRLRIGFVSGDLVDHPVTSFLLPVVEHLARDNGLSLHFYSNNPASDSVTAQIRGHVDGWREVYGLPDGALVQQIRADGIDILIDLAGHSGRNRLAAFAHRPAPVQVSWIGNPATTGLTSIDYYLSDRFVTPLAQFAGKFSEKLVFLPALAPFRAPENSPPVDELPASRNGFLTFGSFSRMSKIGPAVVALWARVLREVPDARLVIGSISGQDEIDKLTERFAAEGIDAARLGFLPRKGMRGYQEQHHQIDVCLDAFPFGGSTTTLQALWMGVPTVTLPGDSMASRSSTGWLSLLGLDAPFVAHDKDDYVRKCVTLAADIDALATLRRELRQHCAQSSVFSAKPVADAASRALRIMWQRWCDGLAPEHFDAALPVPAETGVPAADPQPEHDIAVADAAGPARRDDRRASAREMRQYTDLFGKGKIEAALKTAHRLTQQYPSHGECWLALACALQRAGRHTEFASAAERAATLLPDTLSAQTLLADALKITRQFEQAETHCREALKRHPDSAGLHHTLGVVLQSMGRHAQSIACFRRAVALTPDNALAYDALGVALLEYGESKEAESALRRALELAPTQAQVHSNLLFCLMHKNGLDAASAFAEYREFATRHEAHLRARRPKHANDRNPSRRLKIGFVSGDLFNHPIAYFLLSIVENLARDTSLALHFYSNHTVSDGYTDQIRAHAQGWHPVSGISDAVLAEKIRGDGIDILIDLSGHTGRNRLVTFAHKPAPVQVSWIGNPSTTGLTAIDYYMSDRFVTPLEQFAGQFSEKLVFLPALAPFKPHPHAPDVNALPALKNGFMTFGSFSKLLKIGPEVIALWARVLREVPHSRMVIGAIVAPEQMSKVSALFANEGIDASRISFLPRAGMAAYLAQHHQIDVCLDAFPFAGSTTTMHALWMGVPTVTLPGFSMASRGSTGWLSHLGIDDAFVARDENDFVRKCVALAADLDALAMVRRELRAHCAQSSLISAGTIAEAASRALRAMWQRWCDGLEPAHFEVPARDANAPAQPVAARESDTQAAAGTTAASVTSSEKADGVPAAIKPIRFVCGTRCSREQFWNETALGRTLKPYANQPDVQLQLFDNNSRGLSSIYNEAIEHARQDPAILVFIHDDIWLSDFFWKLRVRRSLTRFDVVGLAGNLRRVPHQPSWAFVSPDLRWDERRYLSGTVGHGKGFPCNEISNFGPVAQECKLLDGLLLIADSETLVSRDVRFDEQFKFHFYDMDFCREAELKGLSMGTWPLSVVHESGGAFGSPGWREGYERYLRKYGS
ncbi:tetratricopeptide repeat protein [Paraburkholderia sp. 40]|uniref:O-linked N-acetylglucosamine transferase family protein n=1 Tax=Paraburkholderia sp. 40 TaxID=2991059 RepID=UPI003D25B8C1